MYKVEWRDSHDPNRVCFAVCNLESAYSLWWSLTGYGRKDSLKPSQVKVFDLSGNEVKMTSGKAQVASGGSYTNPL